MPAASLVPAVAVALAQLAQLAAGTPCPPCHPPDDVVLCTARYVLDLGSRILFGHGC